MVIAWIICKFIITCLEESDFFAPILQRVCKKSCERLDAWFEGVVFSGLSTMAFIIVSGTSWIGIDVVSIL